MFKQEFFFFLHNISFETILQFCAGSEMNFSLTGLMTGS
jgi:hypothetical protein